MKVLTLICVFFFVHSVSGRASSTIPSCEIDSVSKTDEGGHLIRVLCDGSHLVELDLEESGNYSRLSVVGEKNGEEVREFLKIEYFAQEQDMFINIIGEKFDVKDSRHGEESERFKQLLEDPDFRFFPVAVKLIHDELELKGWEAPTIMFLYQLGMAAENFHNSKREEGSSNTYIDSHIYDFNGPNATMECSTGYKNTDLDALIDGECIGICGPGCWMCWQHICGDCCIHNGCIRHDAFCTPTHFTYDCLTGRGVLWNTVTNVPRDC